MHNYVHQRMVQKRENMPNKVNSESIAKPLLSILNIVMNRILHLHM